MQKGFKIFLNILIVLVVLSVIGILGYLAYDYLTNVFMAKEAADIVDQFEQQVAATIVVDITDDNQNVIQEPVENEPQQGSSSSGSGIVYRNYEVIGTIQITKTNVKIPIVDKVTPNSIAAAAALLYGPGLNQIGNNVLVAHNYRNGTFFSNNKKLVEGDQIFITDSLGRKIEYAVTNTYITSDSDFSYATRNTNGKREISLSTCTTNASQRLVIWAREV